MIKTIIFEIKERYKIPCIIEDALYENDHLENKYLEVVSLKQGLHEVLIYELTSYKPFSNVFNQKYLS